MSDIEAGLIRNEWGRIIALALSSQGYAQTDSEAVGLAFLRELEEQGVTLRRMTDIEQSYHNDPSAMADLARKAVAWDAVRDALMAWHAVWNVPWDRAADEGKTFANDELHDAIERAAALEQGE